MFTHCSFDTTKNKLDYYKDNDWTKNFCTKLKEHAIKITACEKKEMIPLTIENKSYCEQKVCYIKNNLVLMIKYTIKWEIIVITLENKQ